MSGHVDFSFPVFQFSADHTEIRKHKGSLSFLVFQFSTPLKGVELENRKLPRQLNWRCGKREKTRRGKLEDAVVDKLAT
jgi:hypothetical protein